jgi:hypothetical protein
MLQRCCRTQLTTPFPLSYLKNREAVKNENSTFTLLINPSKTSNGRQAFIPTTTIRSLPFASDNPIHLSLKQIKYKKTMHEKTSKEPTSHRSVCLAAKKKPSQKIEKKETQIYKTTHRRGH